MNLAPPVGRRAAAGMLTGARAEHGEGQRCSSDRERARRVLARVVLLANCSSLSKMLTPFFPQELSGAKTHRLPPLNPVLGASSLPYGGGHFVRLARK
jgi:hypothetical protein